MRSAYKCDPASRSARSGAALPRRQRAPPCHKGSRSTTRESRGSCGRRRQVSRDIPAIGNPDLSGAGRSVRGFRDPFIIHAGSVPLAISARSCSRSPNLRSQHLQPVGLITLVGLVSKNGILIVRLPATCRKRARTSSPRLSTSGHGCGRPDDDGGNSGRPYRSCCDRPGAGASAIGISSPTWS